MKAQKMPCAPCGGTGRTSQSDGVGGKWDERCYQCQGKGEVEVLVP